MATPAAERSVYLGTFIHNKSLAELEILHDSAVFVDEHGKIVALEKEVKGDDVVQSRILELGWPLDTVIIRACEKEQFFFPGFIGNAFRYRTSDSKFRDAVAYAM
jgi:guanine deaminase